MLKFLACVSVAAMAAPLAAQIGVGTPVTSGVGVATQAELSTQTRLNTPPADLGVATDVQADVAADTRTATEAVEATAETATQAVEATAEVATDAIEAAAQAETSAEVQATNDPIQVAAFVEQEFPTHDADGDGEISRAEFAGWIVPMFTAQLETSMAQAEIDAWADGAFAQADIDSSTGLSRTELTGFLTPVCGLPCRYPERRPLPPRAALFLL